MKQKVLLRLCFISMLCASFTSIHVYSMENKNQNTKNNTKELSWEDQFIKDNEQYTEEDIIIDGIIPKYFNSLIYDNVTKIKDQGDYSTCWAFATIAAMETSLVRNNKCKNSIDLSETQLSYYTYFRPTDKQTDDIFKLEKNKSFTEVGLSQYGTMMSIASGYGVITEEKMEYERFYENSKYDDYYFYNTDYLVKNIGMIDMLNYDLVKKAIVKYGSVASSFNNEEKYYNAITKSYYQNKIKDTNHAITIIGWNDDYPKNNFKKKPSKNGAWLIKNSYGEDWGNNGYAWISYEDLSIKNANAIFFKLEKNKNKYLHKYQYDSSASTYYLEDVQAQSNVFTSLNNEVLTDIAFFPYEPDLQHKISIYKNIKNEPTNGNLVLSFNTKTEYKGYYTIKLPQNIELLKNETFSIVIESFNNKNNNNTTIYIDCTDNWDDWICKCKSFKGQSYIKYNNNWHDASIEYDANCRIKALTKKY